MIKANGQRKLIGHERLEIFVWIPRRLDRRRCWLALPFLLSVMASMDGRAGPTGSETTEIRLRYDRRDLASPAAAHRLLMRIDDAAVEACGASPFSLSEVKMATRLTRRSIADE
jgi:UrcA family protein